jgi:DNA primase
MISPEKIQEITSANEIVDVISSYIPLKKRGKNYMAVCPFHPDKNPSMTVSIEKQVFHCFGCGAGGNVISFVQKYEKITFTETVELLAKRAGIEIKYKSGSPDLSNEISNLYEMNRLASIHFKQNLSNISGGEREFIHDYIRRRKFKKQTMTMFEIGYSGRGKNDLIKYFKEETPFKEADMESAGLVIKSERGNYYDRFQGRLMFPIFTENGKITGFGGRKLFEDDQMGKYVNSPETKIYNKSRILYGLNFAKEFIKNEESVILVEGYMDLISLYQAGFKNIVASSGTALTEEQVKILKRYTGNIIMIYDSDEAGEKATRRGIEIILKEGMDTDIVTLPEGDDPDSIISNSGKDEFEKHLNNKKDIITYISSLYKKENKLETVNDKVKFTRDIINNISYIPDAIKRGQWLKELSKRYNLFDADLREALDVALKRNRRPEIPKTSVYIPERTKLKGEERISLLEKELIEVLVKGDEKSHDYIAENIDVPYLENKTVIKIVERFLQEYIDEGKVDISQLLNKFEKEEEKSLITEFTLSKHEISTSENFEKHSFLKITENPKQNYLKYAKDVIKKIKIRKLEKEIAELKKDKTKLNNLIALKREVIKLNKQ